MKTWGHHTVSSTHNLVRSLQFSLKNIMSIMQGSARGFWRGGSAVVFHTCANHCLISSVSKGESKTWHRQRTCQVLHYVRAIFFLCSASKPSRMSFYSWFPLVYRRKNKGRKKEAWSFLFLLFSFPFSTPPSSSQLQIMQQFSHKTTSNLLLLQSNYVTRWGSSLSRYLEIWNCNC